MKIAIQLILVLVLFANPVFSCSVFMATDGSKTYFGNNEDETNSYSVETFIPAANGKYGYFYMESPHDPSDANPSHEPPMIEHYPQGGMNDQGLAYDITFTPLKGSRQMKFAPGLKVLEPAGEYQGYVLRKVLAEAATVEEALRIIQQYVVPEFFTIQVFLADKGGHSAVLGIGKDDYLSVIRNSKNYQVLTNYSQADPENSIILDPRADIASDMLKEDSSVNVANFLSVMAAIHVEGLSSTVYSTVYDLNKGDIYFYYFHNFQKSVKMNLNKELKKGKHSFVMSSLFKPIFAQTTTSAMSATFSGLVRKLEACREELPKPGAKPVSAAPGKRGAPKAQGSAPALKP